MYEDNLHHIKARDILIDAIQAAIDNPAMTSEIKETANFFILLLEETGNSFKYDSDAVIDPVVQIARVEIPSKGGSKRAANDERTKILLAIEQEAIKHSEQFKRFGYQAQFVKKMLAEYNPLLTDDKAIIKRLKKLKDNDQIENYIKK